MHGMQHAGAVGVHNGYARNFSQAGHGSVSTWT